MHLGMSGSFRVAQHGGAATPGRYYHEKSKLAAHDHVVFHMSSGAVVSFNDPRRFGSMKLVARRELDEEPLLRRLGPEPLGNEFDAAMLAQACHGKQTSLKAALLDQTIVAGLGNIYVCEALNRARLSPRRVASTIATRTGAPHPRTAPLVDAIKAVLNDAIKAGGSSLRDHRQTSGELGMFQHNFRVYDREGQTVPDAGLQGHHPPLHAERALDVLLPGLPDITKARQNRRAFVTQQSTLQQTQQPTAPLRKSTPAAVPVAVAVVPAGLLAAADLRSADHGANHAANHGADRSGNHRAGAGADRDAGRGALAHLRAGGRSRQRHRRHTR